MYNEMAPIRQRLMSFNTHYKCYSILMLPGAEREDVERGGKSK